MILQFIRKVVFFLFTIFIVITFIALANSVFHFYNPQEKYSFTISPQTVIKQIQSLNRLETAQYTIEKIIDAGTTGSGFKQFLFGDKLLLIAQGNVVAGIDLAKVKLGDIQVDGKTLRVTLPAPEILLTSLRDDLTRVYDRKTGLLTKGDKNLESKAREKATLLIRDAACRSNILDTASTNARNQLTALFKSLGFTTVIVTIPQANCP